MLQIEALSVKMRSSVLPLLRCKRGRLLLTRRNTTPGAGTVAFLPYTFVLSQYFKLSVLSSVIILPFFRDRDARMNGIRFFILKTLVKPVFLCKFAFSKM
jgi:hypothetical protein